MAETQTDPTAEEEQEKAKEGEEKEETPTHDEPAQSDVDPFVTAEVADFLEKKLGLDIGKISRAVQVKIREILGENVSRRLQPSEGRQIADRLAEARMELFDLLADKKHKAGMPFLGKKKLNEVVKDSTSREARALVGLYKSLDIDQQSAFEKEAGTVSSSEVTHAAALLQAQKIYEEILDDPDFVEIGNRTTSGALKTLQDRFDALEAEARTKTGKAAESCHRRADSVRTEMQQLDKKRRLLQRKLTTLNRALQKLGDNKPDNMKETQIAKFSEEFSQANLASKSGYGNKLSLSGKEEKTIMQWLNEDTLAKTHDSLKAGRKPVARHLLDELIKIQSGPRFAGLSDAEKEKAINELRTRYLSGDMPPEVKKLSKLWILSVPLFAGIPLLWTKPGKYVVRKVRDGGIWTIKAPFRLMGFAAKKGWGATKWTAKAPFKLAMVLPKATYNFFTRPSGEGSPFKGTWGPSSASAGSSRGLFGRIHDFFTKPSGETHHSTAA